MPSTTTSTTQPCAVCGQRHGLVIHLPHSLADLGTAGQWAHPACVNAAFRRRQRRLRRQALGVGRVHQ